MPWSLLIFLWPLLAMGLVSWLISLVCASLHGSSFALAVLIVGWAMWFFAEPWQEKMARWNRVLNRKKNQ